MVFFTCVNCNKEFGVYPSRAKKGEVKYCSKECKFEHFKVKETEKRSLIKCDCCEIEFLRYNYRKSKNEKNYCSYECMGKDKERLEECTCENCNNTFLAKRSRNKLYQARFCSLTCRDEFYKYDLDGNEINTNRICPECREPFTVRRDEIRRGKGIYCSDKCKYEAKKCTYGENDSHFYSSSEWKKLKLACRKQYDYTCQMCGIKHKSVHVHHIIPRRIGGPDELNNLITLCESCHVKTEWLLRKALKKQLNS